MIGNKVGFLLILLACSSRATLTQSGPSGFQLITYPSQFRLMVDQFIKNDALCATHGIPYALVIGKPKSQELPNRISVLLWCDNSIYYQGQELSIQPIADPTKETSLHVMYFVKDTLINKQKISFIIGSENPGIWGKVIKDN